MIVSEDDVDVVVIDDVDSHLPTKNEAAKTSAYSVQKFLILQELLELQVVVVHEAVVEHVVTDVQVVQHEEESLTFAKS